MNLKEEQEETIIKYNVDIEDEEYQSILAFGREKCPQEEIDHFIFNWAVVHALKSYIDKDKNNEK